MNAEQVDRLIGEYGTTLLEQLVQENKSLPFDSQIFEVLRSELIIRGDKIPEETREMIAVVLGSLAARERLSMEAKSVGKDIPAEWFGIDLRNGTAH